MNTATQLLERCKRVIDEDIFDNTPEQAKLLEDIEAYLAKQQVEQEPAAWLVTTELQDGTRSTYPLTGRYKDVRDNCDFGEPIPLYTQYSGSLIVHKGCKATWANGVIEVMPVVREPMSDDEIDEVMIDNKNYRTFARAIEAHHGIK